MLLTLGVLAHMMTASSAGDTVKVLLSSALAGLIGATIGAWLGAYFGKRGEIAGLQARFHTVLEQTKCTTELVRRIEEELKRQTAVGETELAYRERQLAEFYGPIYGSIKSSGKLWRLQSAGKLTPIANEVTEFFRQHNSEVVQILKAKSHLVDGAEIPECFASYMASVTLYNIGTRVGGGFTHGDVSNLEEARFPEEFFSYIIETTQRLKRRQQELFDAFGFKPPTGDSVPRAHTV
jgi:hypothetical protein